MSNIPLDDYLDVLRDLPAREVRGDGGPAYGEVIFAAVRGSVSTIDLDDVPRVLCDLGQRGWHVVACYPATCRVGQPQVIAVVRKDH